MSNSKTTPQNSILSISDLSELSRQKLIEALKAAQGCFAMTTSIELDVDVRNNINTCRLVFDQSIRALDIILDI